MIEVRPPWWTTRRVVLAILGALVVATVAFVYRFNTLSGTLGGLGNDHFAQLMRSEMLLRGERPLRDFVDSELRGAWPALSYAVPAWAQQIGGRSLLSEVYLTVGALAVAYVLVFVLALDFSRRWTIATLAALAAILTFPKLYNYPKVLMPALAVLAIRLLMPHPSAALLGLAAAVTAVAAFFRHDYGVLIAVGVLAGLIARDTGAWRVVVRRAMTYLGLLLLFLLPSAVWVQVYEGIPHYIRAAVRTSGVEASRTELRMPRLDVVAPFTGDSLLALTYAMFWAITVVALALVAVRIAKRSIEAPERGLAVSLIALAAVVSVVFLRSNLGQRFGDAVVPVVLLAAWTAGSASGLPSAATRAAALVIPALLLCAIAIFAWRFTGASREITNGNLSWSWTALTERYAVVREDLRSLPPAVWTKDNADGILVAARYISQCTTPDDRLLVAGYAPEISVFARRRFAAGQATISLSMYTSEEDQRLAIARLDAQSVPVVLAEARDFEEGFVSDYPLLAKYIAGRYREAGTIAVDREPRFLVFVDTRRQPRGVDPFLGLPCFQ